MDIEALARRLRREGGDRADVEVKAAAGGLPRSLASTLSAFANMPGGGLVVLGLDESAGFAVVGVQRPSVILDGLASVARQALDPPVTFAAEQAVVDGKTLVVARVDELPTSAKPCRVRASGTAYLRAHDGDYELSQVEQQALLAARDTPAFDAAPVAGTGRGDLDAELLSAYLASCRSTSPRLAAMDDPEVLRRTGVTTGAAGELTLAGLVAMGVYPQQHLPTASVQAWAPPRGDDPPSVRALDSRRFDGPLPVLLDEVVAWVSRATPTRLLTGADGHVRDDPDLPPAAVRELVANALIHRDYGPWALSQSITLRLDSRRMVLSNPGGLWGITVQRLGRSGVTSARNATLLRICQHLRTGGGGRVVEALATGIPTVLASVRAAGMEDPGFFDQGIFFTVSLARGPAAPGPATTTVAPAPRQQVPRRGREANARAVEEVLGAGPTSVVDLVEATGMTRRQVAHALSLLREQHRAVLLGGAGVRGSRYALPG